MGFEESLSAALGIEKPEDIGLKSFSQLDHCNNEDIYLEGEVVEFTEFNSADMQESIRSTATLLTTTRAL